MDEPGASRFRKLALFESKATMSVLVVLPTETALEIQPGHPVLSAKLSFPDAMIVAMLTERKLSITVLVAGLAASQEA